MDKALYRTMIALEQVSDAQDTSMIDILDALVGVCLNEEEAGDIKQCMCDDDGT
jgi:hypothetical protein